MCEQNTHFVHFSGERAERSHQILQTAQCPQGLQNLGANPQERDRRAESLRGGARGTLDRTQGMLASPSPRPSRWGSAFSVPGEAVAIGRTLASLPGARRVVLRGAQRLKDRQGARAPRPLARSASGLPPIRATLQPRVLPPMPGSRLLPSLGAPRGWTISRSGLCHPLHPCPVPLLSSGPPSHPQSLAFCLTHLPVSERIWLP